MKDSDIAALFGPKFPRLFADVPTPINPMEDAMDINAIDLGHPLQNCGEPVPFDEPKFTPNERSNIANFKTELERKRREANKRDADKGVAWTDPKDVA